MKSTGACLAIAALAVCINLTAATSSAQQPPITVPRNFARTFSNTDLPTPFGRTKYFGQTWYRGDSMGGSFPIRQIGFRTGPNATYSATTVKLAFVLDNSQLGFAGLTTNFVTNLSSSATTFYSLKNLSVPAANKNQDPTKPAVWIPGDQVKVFTGPHLIVQADVQTGTTASATGWNTEGYFMNNVSDTRVDSVGTSCGKSTLTSSYVSPRYTLTVTGAPASAPVTFYIGVDNQRLAGGSRLPFDLSGTGMRNCLLQLDPLAAVTVTADASGKATMGATVHAPASAFYAFIQAAHPEQGTNPANYVATGMEAVMAGGAGVSTYVYNYTTFGTQAQYGPYPTNRGQIMLFR
jgi:hypothetical protein